MLIISITIIHFLATKIFIFTKNTLKHWLIHMILKGKSAYINFKDYNPNIKILYRDFQQTKFNALYGLFRFFTLLEDEKVIMFY